MSKKIDSIVIKFRMEPEVALDRYVQCLFELKDSFCLVAEKTNTLSQTGILKFLMTGSSGILSSSTNELPIFNGEYWNLLLKRSVATGSVDVDQEYVLKTNITKFDTLNFYNSCSLLITGSLTSSYNTSYNNGVDFYVGGALPTSSLSTVSYIIYPFIGAVSSLKFYNSILSDISFEQQCFSENIVSVTNISASFEDLVTYLKFDDNKNLQLTSSLYDSNLSAYGKNHGTASGFTSNAYNTRYETDIVKVPITSLNQQISSKIIIDDSSPSLEYLPESSSIKKYGNNSNKIDFIFSPANMDNRNILKYLNLQVYDYIGDPGFLIDEVGSYSNLEFLYKYYRKYVPTINLQEYINNIYLLSKPLFKNIHQFIPERADFNGGISIEPNLLERTNVVMHKSVNISNLAHSAVLPSTLPQLDVVYNLHTASIFSGDLIVSSSNILYTSSISNVEVSVTSNNILYSTDVNMTIDGNDSEYLFKGTGILIERDDKIILQGIKRKLLKNLNFIELGDDIILDSRDRDFSSDTGFWDKTNVSIAFGGASQAIFNAGGVLMSPLAQLLFEASYMYKVSVTYGAATTGYKIKISNGVDEIIMEPSSPGTYVQYFTSNNDGIIYITNEDASVVILTNVSIIKCSNIISKMTIYGTNEIATSSYIEPISNMKYYINYMTSSGNYIYARNSAMEPLYDANYNVYYASNHIKFHIYDSIGRQRSRFLGTLNTGPEHDNGATTGDGGKVIEITYSSPNKITVNAQNEDKARLKVDGIDLNL